jgi:hypothetical protein
MNNSPEKNSLNPEQREVNTEALEKAGEEHRERLREDLERAKDHKEDLDEARHEALEKASSIEHEKKEEDKQREVSPAEKRKGPIGKAEREASFNTTMQEVQSQMSGPSRAFSKVIHNKTVEKVSEVAGDTIARPNAMLSGAIFAFLLTLAVYLVAKNLGYPLSGFETIGAFILGWVIGILYDFLKVMITGRK